VQEFEKANAGVVVPGLMKNDSDSETVDPKQLEASLNREQKLTEWEKEPLISDLKGDLEYARQENTDQRANVEGWLALRNATGNESGKKSKLPGRSSVQPKLIRKHNEWRYPALSEPFLNDYKVFTINPRTFEDKVASVQNQLVLNYQFDTKMHKVAFIDKFVRKTVDEGTCIIRVGWNRTTERVMVEKIKYDYYPLNDPEQLAILAQATQMFMEDPDAFEMNMDIPDSLKASVEYSAENRTPVYALENGVEQVYEDKIVANHPSVKIINVENFFIDPSCEGNWEEAQFMIHTYESTKSELLKRKIYSNLDAVNWSQNAIKSKLGDPDHKSNSPQIDARLNTDKVKVLVYEYWGLYDIHGTGEMVPIVVTFIGDTIIQMQENPFPDRKFPFVIVPYMPIDGSTFGEADASLLQDNQRILGAVTRGVIDLLGRSANGQTGYAKGFLDTLNRQRFGTGQDFEFNPNADPRIAIQQMTYPDVPQSAMLVIQNQNQEAEGLSGVKSFSTGITGDAFGKVAKNTGAVLDAAGQREMSILRRLAEGMRQIGNKMISMNAKFMEKKEVIRITNGEFVEIRKEDLAGNFDLICDIASAQADELKSQDLGMVMQTIGPDMDPGLRGVIMAEIFELKRMPELAQQVRSYQPQPDPMQVKMQELQIALLEAQIAEVQSKTAKNQADAENTALDTELEVTGTKHQRNVETQGAQARGNRDLEVTKGLVKGEAPAQNIEAAVGFNKLTEAADAQQAKPATPVIPWQPPVTPVPMAPLQSAQPQQVPQGLAMPV